MVDDLRVRSQPKVSADSVKYTPTLAWGTRLLVEEAPVAGSGYWWCRVTPIGRHLKGGVDGGWVAVAARDGTPWVAVGETAILVAITDRMVGSWRGTVTTPWTGRYGVSLVFRADGSYSARSNKGPTHPALYWGTDSDSPSKTYAINDILADGTASGTITITFGSDSTVVDELADVAFQGDRMTFSLTHLRQYGPITFALTRT